MYICPLLLESPSHLPPSPTSLGYYRAPVGIPWVIQQIPIGYLFTYVGAYAFMLLSPFISSSPSCPLPLSVSPFSMYASLLLLCEQICWCHFLHSIYMLSYMIFLFFLSDFLHCLIGSRSIHFIRTDSNVFLSMAAFHIVFNCSLAMFWEGHGDIWLHFSLGLQS